MDGFDRTEFFFFTLRCKVSLDIIFVEIYSSETLKW